MKNLLSNIKLFVPESIYIKDPESSDLGKRIVSNSILLIDEIGFESFTFKKLGVKIGSNESSIYRYFESKHKLLVYLTSWFWAWKEYQLVFETANIDDCFNKLEKAVKVITRTIVEDSTFNHINEVILNRIVIHENSKSFLTKDVDEENKQGHFLIYKRIVNRLSEMIVEVNPNYPFSLSLASTILEGALHQHFVKDHFKSITNCDADHSPTEFFTDLISRLLKV